MLILGALLFFLSVVFATKNSLLLPKTLYATKYNLTVDVNLPFVGAVVAETANFKQNGTVLISLIVREPTSDIVLNADDIDIKQTWFFGRTVYENLPLSYSKSVQKLRFWLPYELAVGEKVQLKIEYSFLLRSEKDKALGFYRSTWVDQNGVTHHIASTQFKTIHARKVVPCLDDPTFRAAWTITVNVPPGYRVASNTLKNYALSNSQSYQFFETPSISSYLVAFVVHDQHYIKTLSPKGFEYGLIGPSERIYNCNELLEFTGEMIDILMDKFKVVKYRFPKLDIISIPRMSSFATENPGLITLASSFFCTNYTNVDGFTTKEMLIHELLHQWFGNSVTPNGWENLMMSEGFVAYYDARIGALRNMSIADRILPGKVISLSPLPYKQPNSIEEAVNAGNSATNIKAGAIFKMFETLIGVTNFDLIINSYLKKNENKWGSIEEFLRIAEHDLKKPKDHYYNLLMPYFKRSESPVVLVKKEINGFSLKPVLASNDSVFNDYYFDTREQNFYVPVWYGTSANQQLKLIVTKVGQPMFIETDAPIMFVNPYGISYHRTYYVDENMWLPIAHYSTQDTFWKLNTKLDFVACYRYYQPTNYQQVLSILN